MIYTSETKATLLRVFKQGEQDPDRLEGHHHIKIPKFRKKNLMFTCLTVFGHLHLQSKERDLDLVMTTKHQNADEELDAATMRDFLVVRDHVTMMTVKMSKCRRQRQDQLVRDQDLEMIVNNERDPDLETILRDQSDQGQEIVIMLIDARYIPAGCDPNTHLATKGQPMRRRVHLPCQYLKRLGVLLIVGSSLNRR